MTGPKDLIKRARHFRKAFGGAWRQAGFLAELGMHCIDHNWPGLLQEDHENAKVLASGLADLGFIVLNRVETNMVCGCDQ